ncbi:unnamed protein product [Timema podura]|uniref:Uncharacterized protein n=1 Tax=Timema podura TaxID=61482 RepID=A0ABN7PNF0_TIMPD|nr:unnamed protein product [Timema podura]
MGIITCDVRGLSAELWDKYSNVFTSMWAATAFKGSTGSCQLLPVIQHHVSNHEQWLLVLGQEAGKFQHFRGVALTGWSRYDHYAIMCELLPVSIPSLVMCLKVWLNGSFNYNLHLNTAKSLGYSDTPLLLNPYPSLVYYLDHAATKVGLEPLTAGQRLPAIEPYWPSGFHLLAMIVANSAGVLYGKHNEPSDR